MKVNFLRLYKYAFRGVDVREFAPGVTDVPEEVAEQAVTDGAAKPISPPSVETPAPAATAEAESAPPPASTPAAEEPAKPRPARGRRG